MKKTVQAYIEEIPNWQDGSSLGKAPLSGMQWLVWSLATAGKFFEGLIVFMGGIALPLVQLLKQQKESLLLLHWLEY